MKKLMLALALVWSATACQQPDATIAPVSDSGSQPASTANLTVTPTIPDDIDWQTIPVTTKPRPFPSPTHGVVVLYSTAIGRKAPNGETITRAVVYDRDSYNQNRETYLKTFTTPFDWNAWQGTPPQSLLNDSNSLYLKIQPKTHLYSVYYYNAKGAMVLRQSHSVLNSEPFKYYFRQF
ncbi:hypothetical protein GCM10027299_45280 [Larkinella ripae]